MAIRIGKAAKKILKERFFVAVQVVILLRIFFDLKSGIALIICT
jgi:hypothetical protein